MKLSAIEASLTPVERDALHQLRAAGWLFAVQPWIEDAAWLDDVPDSKQVVDTRVMLAICKPLPA